MTKTLSIGLLVALIATVGWTLLRPQPVGAGQFEAAAPKVQTSDEPLPQDGPVLTSADAPQERSLLSETQPSSKSEDPPSTSTDLSLPIEIKAEGKARTEFKLVDGEIEGEYLEYATNGQLIVQAFYSAGVLNGPWGTWRTDGVRTSIGKYVDGRREGIWVHWKSQGKMHKTLTYLNDKLEGRCETFDELGVLLEEESGWFENGVRIRDLLPGDE